MRTTAHKIRKDSRFPVRAPMVKALHQLGLSFRQIALALQCSIATVTIDCGWLGLRGRHPYSSRKKQFQAAVLQFAQTRFSGGPRRSSLLPRPKEHRAMTMAVGLEMRIGWNDLKASVESAAIVIEQMVRPVVPEHAAGYLRLVETMVCYRSMPIKVSDFLWYYFHSIANRETLPPSTWTEMRDDLIGQMTEQYRSEARPIWTNKTVETIEEVLRKIPVDHASILRQFYGIGEEPKSILAIVRVNGTTRSQAQSKLSVAQRHLFRSAAFRQLIPTIWPVREKTDELLQQQHEARELLRLRQPGPDKEHDRLQHLLARPVAELELSVRTSNCLRHAQINTLGQLVVKSDTELLHYRNFGQKCLQELHEVLAEQGLHLGMNSSALSPASTVEHS